MIHRKIAVVLTAILLVCSLSFGVHASTAYVAKKGSYTFHEQDCRYLGLLVGELISFDSYAEAKAAGLKPCYICIDSTESEAPLPVLGTSSTKADGTADDYPAMTAVKSTDTFNADVLPVLYILSALILVILATFLICRIRLTCGRKFRTSVFSAMKIWIYSLCFFTLAMVRVLLENMGITFSGAIPAAIETGLAIWCAHGLCKVWDRKKERKSIELEAMKDRQMTIKETVEESKEGGVKGGTQLRIVSKTEGGTVQPAEVKKRSKQRYCKFCGGAIDTESQKCTKCGKQCFKLRIKKETVVAVFAILVILGLAILNVYQYIRSQTDCANLESLIAELTATIQDLEDTIEKKDSTIQSKQIEISRLKAKNSNLAGENYLMSDEIEFYDMYVVFVSDDGTNLYHKYDCVDFDTSYFWAYNTDYFWAYNTETAKGRGYKPCPKCCK